MKDFRKTADEKFICEECEKTYIRKSDLSYHITHKHNGIKMYYDKWLKEEHEGFCKICGEKTEFNKTRYMYENGCCKEHMNEWNYIQIKRGFKEKYGVECLLGIPEIRNKGKKTKLLKYGNENFVNIKKRKKTNLQKYGVDCYFLTKECKNKVLVKYNIEDNIFQSKEIKEKCKQTMLKNHGVEHALQSKEIKNNMKLNLLKDYNVDHNFKIPEVIEKRKQTWLINLGVENPSQNENIHKKQQSFKLKYFKNTNIYYRGTYEFDFLDKHYDLFPDIINAKSIKYLFENKQHYYYPDFYIPSLNLIIEVKALYYYNKFKNQCKAKKKATIANGFKYIMIINKDYSIFNILSSL
jgi:hypothetical protein